MDYFSISILQSLLIIYFFSLIKCQINKTSAEFLDKYVTLELSQSMNNSIYLISPFKASFNDSSVVNLYFTYQIDGEPSIFRNESFLGKEIIIPIPDINVHGNDTGPFYFSITAKMVGSLNLGINSSDVRFKNLKSVYSKVVVIYSNKLKILGDVIGWIYFAAWTVSFYPQVILNCYKRSVVGLNFDFILFNWLGFFSYSCFNVGLYWIPSIKEIFHDRHPRNVNPVQLNDVIFSLHALVIVTLQVVMCFILEKGKQRVSRFGAILFSAMIVYTITIVSLAGSKTHLFSWLDFLYYLSYLKLFITIIKYIPQAYMNFKRKSTVGWSIWNVLLDFTGGLFSLIQMFILSHNNDDWKGFFSDPTKFGLGLFSILFDIVFITQHYILYRHPKDSYEILPDEDNIINLG